MDNAAQNNDTDVNKDPAADPGADAAAAAAAAAKQTDDGGDGDAGDQPQLYRPEGLPDHLVGANDHETIDKMQKALDGFRKDLSKKGVPETADAYELKLPDEIKDKVLRPGEDGKDPLLEKMKVIAHKHGQSNDAFNEMAVELYQAVAEQVGAAAGDAGGDDLGEFAPDFDFKSAGGIEKAQPDIDAANLWISKLETDGTLDKVALEELKNMATYSQGVHTLKALRIASGEKPIPKNPGKDGPAGMSLDEIKARYHDEKYYKERDTAFIEETQRLMDDYYKNHPDEK